MSYQVISSDYMPDQFTKEERSRIMSKVKSKNTSIELKLRKKLWRRGFRYRLHSKLPGTPDIVLAKYKTVIFIDGCFWHGCAVCNPKMPLTNKEYWETKIKRNILRAKRADRELAILGWNVIHVWEHQMKKDFNDILENIIKEIIKRQ